MRLRYLTPLLLLLALALAGCGSNAKTAPGPVPKAKLSDRLVDFSLKPPFVNALEIDPVTNDFLLTTNRGFWRIDPKTKAVEQVKGTISARGKKDTVGTFLEIESEGPNKLIGSGHPDNQNTLPQFLGFIESSDNGKTWKVLSRLGEADLHKIVIQHGKIFAFDAVLGAMLISDDRGKTWQERFTPRGLVIDFVVDPQDENYLLAATEEELYRSTDQGEGWRAVTAGTGIRLAWPAVDKLYRADQDGRVFLSSNRGDTFTPISKVQGEPYKFKTTEDPDHVYLALSDGTIVETTDGAKSWKAVFTP